jgi:hypothetical protein
MGFFRFQMVRDAMSKGSDGICQILDIMESCLAEPKSGKVNWPVSERLDVPIAQRAKFLGPGAYTTKSYKYLITYICNYKYM